MKLEHIQNELKNHVGGVVRAEAKEATVLWLHEKGLPAAREVSAAYTAALKESAEKETGWCRSATASSCRLSSRARSG